MNKKLLVPRRSSKTKTGEPIDTTITLTAKSTDKGERLDVLLEDRLTDQSRSHIKKLIEAGHILVNAKNVKAGYSLKVGDKITVKLPPLQADKPTPQAIALNILFEDKDIIVINKPFGMTVHPGAGRHENTLVNALLHHCKDLSGIGGVKRPGIVHRLDQDTSGVIVVAKHDKAHQSLSEQFKTRKVNKIYVAVVQGNLKHDQGEISFPIGRHPSQRTKMMANAPGKTRHAMTRYEVKERHNSTTVIYCFPETGRTHQIRVHLAAIGHPIIGDKLYNPKSTAHRLMLHAFKLGLFHPKTNAWTEFLAALPKDFK